MPEKSCIDNITIDKNVEKERMRENIQNNGN